MERLLISQLLKWKDSHGRKPLILEGARQVGSHQSLAIREKQQFKNHQHPPLYALCSRQRIKGRKLVLALILNLLEMTLGYSQVRK